MSMKKIAAILILTMCLSSLKIVGQQKEILLWPNGAPGSEGKTGKEKVRIHTNGEHILSNIHFPSITPYLPNKKIAKGIAVVVAPGGGHREIWIDHEGYNIAEYLQQKGIAVFVLKYRLARDSGSTYTIDKEELGDMQRAIRYVKSHAKEWNIDPEKIGVMGFSAGGEVAGLSAMKFDDGKPSDTDPIERMNSRPAFQALIYPGGTSRLEAVKNTPPLFILGGFNDSPAIAEGIAQVYLKYKKAGVPAELHIYSNAAHGFGLRKTNKGPVATWLERFVEWVNDTFPKE